MRLETGGWNPLIALAWLAIPRLCDGYDSPIPASPDVCEFRTVNYITHTLPQQCLRTSWTSPSASSATTAVESASTTASPANTTAPAESSDKKPHGETREKEPDQHVSEEQDSEEDLASSSFMSFEEWKEMMVRKSGQDPAAIKGHKPHKDHKPHRDTGDGHADLDSLGDDGEISIDFGALSDKVSELTASKSGGPTPEANVDVREEQVLLDDGKMQYYRSKDAGTTCKERFSYSSFDAGSTIKKTSPGAKNARSILVENKDSYMLMECHAKTKFVIVELSDDILVDTVVLANFEFFSSMIRKFRVSVSDRYPVKLDKWVELGTFEARNSRDIQAFLIEHPQIYTKYIQIEFLTHYGNEYYCPVSLLRVHGTRMLDSWKEPDTIDEPEPTPDVIPEEQTTDVGPQATETVVKTSEPSHATEPNSTTQAQGQIPLPSQVGISPWQHVFSNATSMDVCDTESPITDSPTPVTSPTEPVDGDSSVSVAARQASTSPPTSTSGQTPQTNISGPAETVTERPSGSSSSSSTTSSTPIPPTESTASPKAPAANPHSKQQPSPKTNATATPSSSVKVSSSSTQSAPKNRSSTSSSPPASPTVQESFFKAVTKRLQHLESNTSLSLQYIEEQSRFLQEALQKMQKRQISRVDAFLDSLNKTVFAELHNVRAQYDQIWQSTVIALESQRDQSQRETVALSERLSLLADEVVFQKRMAILQSVLLLAALVLVIFSRGYYVNGPAGDMLGHQSRFSFQSHNYRDSVSAPALVDSPPGQLGDDLDLDADYSAGSPSPPNRQDSASSRRTLSRTGSYNDKVLPLTPDSKSASEYMAREPTPAINVVDTDVPFFYDYITPPHGTGVNQRRHRDESMFSDDSEAPDSVEGSPAQQVDGDGRRIDELTMEQDVMVPVQQHEQANTLSRRSVTSQLGSARKPLPALPEDMSEDDELEVPNDE